MKDTVNKDMTIAAWQALVTAWGATDEIRLFTNDGFQPTETTLASEFIEPVGAWYDPTTKNLAVYKEVFIDQATGLLCIPVADTQYDWAAAGGAIPEEITGYWVAKADGSTWRFAKRLPAPITLGTTYASLYVKPGALIPLIY